MNDSTREIDTEYGSLRVPVWLLKIWNDFGWPEDEVLRKMVEDGRVDVEQEGPEPRS